MITRMFHLFLKSENTTLISVVAICQLDAVNFSKGCPGIHGLLSKLDNFQSYKSYSSNAVYEDLQSHSRF